MDRRRKWSLLDLQVCNQTQWKSLTKFFPGKTDNSIKNQFFATVRKGLRKAMKLTRIGANSSIVNRFRPKIISSIFGESLEIPANLLIEEISPIWISNGKTNLKMMISFIVFDIRNKCKITEKEEVIIRYVLNWIEKKQ